eukprot:TRINITY_DN3144_c0_g1_i1.p1 TRINITY_DN3144_c0_g1~~TRINITY_DN3144_c0_g1_i1.p1  ORF type:complete len:526 (-),score=82.16 TRINITY_DN3144_c0_g1_i1:15-1592(-)
MSDLYPRLDQDKNSMGSDSPQFMLLPHYPPPQPPSHPRLNPDPSQQHPHSSMYPQLVPSAPQYTPYYPIVYPQQNQVQPPFAHAAPPAYVSPSASPAFMQYAPPVRPNPARNHHIRNASEGHSPENPNPAPIPNLGAAQVPNASHHAGGYMPKYQNGYQQNQPQRRSEQYRGDQLHDQIRELDDMQKQINDITSRHSSSRVQAQQPPPQLPQPHLQVQDETKFRRNSGEIPLRQSPKLGTGGSSAPSGKMQSEDEGWEIDISELDFGREVARGSFGVVYRAGFRGTDVAVKKLLVGKISQQHIAEFVAEVSVLRKLHHPNIVLYMGVCTHEPDLCIVYEYMSKGSLWDLLHNSKAPLSWKIILKMASDTAKGMSYLHLSKPTIIHRDLKTPNLLVDDYYNVKIADFGLSKTKSFTSHMTAQTGTPGYMAPEVILGNKYCEKVDVYSFGIILWELITRQAPYHGIPPMQVMFKVAHENLRPPVPSRCPKPLVGIMCNCWSESPESRPPFTAVLEGLKAFERLSAPD